MTTTRAANPTPRRFTFKRLIGYLPRLVLLVLGAVLGAVAVILFMIPSNIAPAGVTGIAVILNHLINTPVGVVIFVLNVPLFALGFRYLGGWRVVVLTMFVIALYSLAFEVLAPFLPTDGISDNALLNALFGGVTGGISTGLVLRAGATFGGTSIIAAILQRRTGMAMSSTYLYTDTAIIFVAGIVYGWEAALYAVVALFVSGIATDYVLEGPSLVRTIVIITDQPKDVADVILNRVQRGVTGWQVTGMYTGTERTMFYVTVSRAEVTELRDLVVRVDSDVFLVVGHGHRAYGMGFSRRHQDAAALNKPPSDPPVPPPLT
jgi:uncharacterized membrane-anchored protein YitT (DUF2179 family)